MADEQSGITHVTLQRCTFFIQLQPDTWLCRIIAAVDDLGITQPKESLRIIPHAGFALQCRQEKLLFMLLQLSRNFLKDGGNLGFLVVRIFADVIAVKSQYVAFHFIYLIKIPCFHIFGNGLRHPPDNQILPEIIHGPAVESAHRKPSFKLHPDIRHQHFVTHGP